jgi:hypothetical protein
LGIILAKATIGHLSNSKPLTALATQQISPLFIDLTLKGV